MKRFIMIVLIMIFIFPQMIGEAKMKMNHDQDYIKIVIQTKNNSLYKSTKTINSKQLMRSIDKKKLIKTLNYQPVSDIKLHLSKNGNITEFLIDESFQLFDLHTKNLYELPAYAEITLKKEVLQLKSKHFGKLIPWQKANQLFPKYSKFKITDIDTGLTFNVQRRAGSHHADVQPLTKKDTEVMKKIYNGKWSWKRRAILLNHEGKNVAASMHGMPHGQGALQNGFPGHFCIHFYLSKTHKKNQVDFSHNIMIHKAAGKMNEYFNTITPGELIDTFLLSIHQKELNLLKLTTSTKQYSTADNIFKQLEDVNTMKRISPYKEIKDFENQLAVVIPVEVQIVKDYQFDKKIMNFLLFRDSLVDSWKIDMQTVLTQLF